MEKKPMELEWAPSKLAVTVDGVLDAKECAALTEAANAAGWKPSPMAPMQSGLRSRVDDPATAAMIFERLKPYVPAIHERRRVIGLTPTLRFVKYGPGCEVLPHPDTAGGDAHTRVLRPNSSWFTCLLYLNEGYEGCETHLVPPPPRSEFSRGVLVEPRAGRALIFDHTVVHGCPPLRCGEKLVCRVDVAYEERDFETGVKLKNPNADSTLRRPSARAKSIFAKLLKKPRSFDGKVAIVTGASSGIGLALCEALSSKMIVLGVARSRVEDKERIKYMQADVTDPTIVDRACELGQPMVLINNAGAGDSKATVLDGDQAACEELFQCNTLAPLALTRKFLTTLIQQKASHGHVVNVSSMSAHRLDAPNLGVYAATKAALRTLTEATRLELQQRDLPYRVSMVSPGLVETSFLKNMGYSQAQSDLAFGVARALQPKDVVDAVLYLLDTPDHVQVHDILIRAHNGH